MIYEFSKIYEVIYLCFELLIASTFFGVASALLVFLVLKNAKGKLKFLLFLPISYSVMVILILFDGFSVIDRYNLQLVENKVNVEQGTLISIVQEKRKNTYDKAHGTSIMTEVLEFETHLFESVAPINNSLEHGCFNGSLKKVLKEYIGEKIEIKYIDIPAEISRIPILCILQVRVI